MLQTFCIGLAFVGGWLIRKLVEEWFDRGYEQGYKDGLYQNVIRYSDKAD